MQNDPSRLTETEKARLLDLLGQTSDSEVLEMREKLRQHFLAEDISSSRPRPAGPGDLREQLAALEHQQWAHWTKYMLKTLRDHGLIYDQLEDGDEGVEHLMRWWRQIDTPYEELSEKEKDSDRVWADKVIQLVVDTLSRFMRSPIFPPTGPTAPPPGISPERWEAAFGEPERGFDEIPLGPPEEGAALIFDGPGPGEE